MHLLSTSRDSNRRLPRKYTSETEKDLLSSPETVRGSTFIPRASLPDTPPSFLDNSRPKETPHDASSTTENNDQRQQQPWPTRSSVVERLQREAEWLERQEQLDKAFVAYKECLRSQDIQESPIDIGDIHYSLGRLQWKRGNYKDCLVHYERAIEVYRDYEVSTLDLVEVFISKGQAHVSQGDLTAAKHSFRCALTVLTACPSECPRSGLLQGKTMHGFALVHEARGTLDRALDYSHDSLAWLKQGQREAGISAANTLLTMGSIYEKQKLYEFSLGCYEEAYSIYTESGASVADIGSAQAHIGWVHYLEEHYDLAIETFKEALKTIHSLGRHHRNVASILVQLGLALASKGQPQKARQHLQRALYIQTQLGLGGHTDVATTLAAMSKVSTDVEEAFDLLDRAFKIRLAALGNQHVVVGVTLLQLGRLYSQLSLFDESSFRCFVDALVIFQNNGLDSSDDLVVEAEKLLNEKRASMVPTNSTAHFRQEKPQLCAFT